jgi:mRNA-degrading endonuclease RelE of RelBE toxin-antitoxin system
VLFIETPIFTKQVKDLLPDTEYRKLQEALLMRPESGDLIPQSGGLRKIRWRIPGKGKRGGLRVIYYWDTPDDTFFMLTVYKKSTKKDLTQEQLKILHKLVEEWLK